MLAYKELNLNPNNEISNDCTTRAICYCLDLPWEYIYRQQQEIATKLSNTHSTQITFNSSMVVHELLESYGFSYYQIDSVLLINFDTVISNMHFDSKAVFICWSTLGAHVVAVTENCYVDNINRGYLEVDSFFVKERKN